ncbi:MAG: hypothetical protein JSS02_31925 [Planctomycetes bacterium]|nr:hypothetical protein [Planctomycetota bacterium]
MPDFLDDCQFTRRDCLRLGLGTSLLGAAGWPAWAQDAVGKRPAAPKTVAGVVTMYNPGSHGDVIFNKLMEGWKHDGGPGPALKLVSLYIDQPETSAFGIATCKKYNVPIFDSIEKAITVGGQSIPVDAVLSVGEHGNYPLNDIGQQLYPRRRFMEEITAAFSKYGKVVPVFNDKHLGPVWTDAKWMYDRARELKIPYMAGSSMPVGFRTAEIKLPLGSDIEGAVGIGYGGLEIYGFHALEFFQSHVERRRGAEKGVKAVRFLEGPALWQAIDQGAVSKVALEAAWAAVPKQGQPDMRQDKEAGLFLFEYADGLTGAVLYLGCASGTSIGIKLKGQAQPIATAFDERTEPRYPHFAYLLKAIEKMIYTGRPTYPVERTLLTSGILDRALNSRARKGQRLETPELLFPYQPVAYPHAPHVDLLAAPVN